jgi:Zn-dependent protease
MITYIFSCIISLVAHELGHIVAAAAAGLKVKKVGFSWKGPYIVREGGSPYQNFFIAIAGPIATIYMIGCGAHHPMLALINIVLLLFNLLPFGPTDGKHALVALIRMCRDGYEKNDQEVFG